MRSIAMTSWFAVCWLTAGATAWGAAEDLARREFPLEEVSAFDVADYGQSCSCRNEPDPNVTYPAFASTKSLYGTMVMGAEFDSPRSGTAYPFAVDESGGTGAGYDRLYVDLNRDGRLGDQPAILPLQELPQGDLFKQKWGGTPVWFHYVAFPSGVPEISAVETVPRLVTNRYGFTTLTFTATKARRGAVEIGGRRLIATVLNGSPFGARWDRPGTIVRLEARGIGRMSSWPTSDRLTAMHWIERRYWRFATTPAGERFFVEPYQGDLGVVRIDAGGWPFRKAAFSGTLLAQDKAVAAGYDDGRGIHQPVESWEAPVGDYSPASLEVRWGPMTFSLASIPAGDVNSTGVLHVRKDRPCVLDLSRKPEVLFTTPGEKTRIRPGDVLQTTAYLAHRQSNVMIRSLSRESRERASPAVLTLIGLTIAGSLGVWLGFGRGKRGYRYLPWLCGVGVLALVGYLGGLFAINAMLHPDRSGPRAVDALRPRVTISRANGEIVAEGDMPFG